MTPDQLQRFVRMEEEIKQLRRDVARLEQELETSNKKREEEARELSAKIDMLIKAHAEHTGSSSTWPKAGALLLGTITAIGALGGWGVLIYNLAKGGGKVASGN